MPTDHPDPTALRLEGQRLVEAATKLPWALREPLEERPWMTPIYSEAGAWYAFAEVVNTVDEEPSAMGQANAALIVFAVNNLPTLLTTLSALTEERDRLRARLAKHEGVDTGDWFYPDGDTSSDVCCDTPEEVLTDRYEAQHNPSAVYVIERAIKLPDIFAAVRVFTEEEKDKRADDEDCAITYHTSREEAEATLTARPTP